MNNLRKLLHNNHEYPPSKEVWLQIVDLAKEKPRKNTQEKLANYEQEFIEQQTTYKPNLPEPLLTRFTYNDNFYYLDGNGRIYQMDESDPRTGNLVGHINPKTFQVTLHNEVIHTIPTSPVKAQTIHESQYYIDGSKSVFQGYHNQLNLIHLIGTLSPSNKIQLLTLE